MYALIFKGQVEQIAAEQFPVCCEMEWVEIPAELDPQPEAKWSYADETFTAPPAVVVPVERSPEYMTLEEQVKNAYDGMILVGFQLLAQREGATLEGFQADLSNYEDLAAQLYDMKHPGPK